MPGNTETTDAEAVDETFPELLDVAEAEPVPSPEPSVAPEPEAMNESVSEPIESAEPAVGTEPEAVETPDTESQNESVPEPAAPEPEAMNESVSEPIESAEPAVEAEPEAAETPDTENQSESVPEPDEAAETMNETVPEPVESEKEEHAVAEAGPEAVGALEAEFASEPLPVLLEETEPAPETGPEITPEPISAPGIEEAPPDANPPISEACADFEPPAAAEPEPAIAPEPAAEPVPEPAPVVDSAAYLVLTTQPTADEKAAARLAARQKKLDESAEQSPFSVIVGQVYDGPLDLLLDLIRKQDIDIYDIPIARITAQFLAYVNQLRASDVDVAGEFIYTASLLIHIKSKMLLPRAETGPEEAAEDPRRELVERLLEHERFKNAAQMLQQKQMLEAASWSNPGAREFKDDAETEPELAADTVDLVRIFREILERARKRPVLDISEDSVTVGQMIQFLARRLTMEDKPLALRRLLSHTRSERALIAMFLALLELVRLQAILLRQDRQFSEIFIKKHSGFDALMNEGLGNARDDWR
jgi:segregation and condensation protein A